jgi:hypothetical protein
MPQTLLESGLLCCLGVWACAGHELLTRAHGLAPENTLMPYAYNFLIFLTIESYLVFTDVPDRWTLSGAAIIMFSGLIIWKRPQISEGYA